MSEFEDKTKSTLSDKGKCTLFDGSNAHVPSKETIARVKSLVSCGVQTKFIAADIEISEPTLFKHYQDVMDRARANAHGRVGQSIFKRAIDGDATAMKLYAKSQMGWKETDAVEHSGKDGGAIEHDHKVSAVEKMNSFLDGISKKSDD